MLLALLFRLGVIPPLVHVGSQAIIERSLALPRCLLLGVKAFRLRGSRFREFLKIRGTFKGIL